MYRFSCFLWFLLQHRSSYSAWCSEKFSYLWSLGSIVHSSVKIEVLPLHCAHRGTFLQPILHAGIIWNMERCCFTLVFTRDYLLIASPCEHASALRMWAFLRWMIKSSWLVLWKRLMKILEDGALQRCLANGDSGSTMCSETFSTWSL